ncbi:unnamed protein product [Brassica oleracea var. botrytis]
MLARRRINGKLFEYTLYTFLLPVLLSNICVASVNNGGFPKPTVTEMGKKLAERIRKQRALHCPDCSLNVLKTGVLMIMCLIFWSYIIISNGIRGFMLLSIYYRFHQHHIFKAKKGEDEHGDLKPASIAEGGNCSIPYIVTSSLISDMNSKIDMYLANGISL